MISAMWNPRGLVMMCGALCLCACGADSPGGKTPGSNLHAVSSHNPKADREGPTREQQTAGMVSAASPAHSADIADLKFNIAARPEPGQPVSIDLAWLPLTETPVASLDLSGSDGLTLPANRTVSFSDVGRAHVYRASVSVTPASEGIYFLNVLVSFRNADFTDTRPFTLPIIVAAPSAAAGPATPARSATATAPARAQ